LTYRGNKNHEKRPAVDRVFHTDRRTDGQKQTQTDVTQLKEVFRKLEKCS